MGVEYKTINMKLPLLRPTGYHEREAVADTLRDNGCALIVLEETAEEEKRGLMEYISGAAYILGLVIRPVARDVFMAAPEENVEAELTFDQTRGE